MARLLDFTDGFTTVTEPTKGSIITNSLQTFANITAFETANGTGVKGDLFFETTQNIIQYNDGTVWRELDDADLVHKTGSETIAGAKTFSDNMVINANLTVTGTTSQIDTTNLEVKDKNINLNDGGTDATSEGAGINIERTGTDGSIVYENALASRFKIGDVGSEKEIADINSTQSLSNKTLTDPVISDDARFIQTTTPAAPAASSNLLYFKSDDKLYKQNSGGTEVEVGTGAGNIGLGLTWIVDSGGPLEGFTNGFQHLDFNQNENQSIFSSFKVPDTYIAGTQIFLKGVRFFTSATSGNVFFKTISTLIEDGDLVTDTTDQETSTNTELTVSVTANDIEAVGDIDITDSSGNIGVTAVAAGDLITIEFKRDTAAETSSAAADVSFIRHSGEVITT